MFYCPVCFLISVIFLTLSIQSVFTIQESTEVIKNIDTKTGDSFALPNISYNANEIISNKLIKDNQTHYLEGWGNSSTTTFERPLDTKSTLAEKNANSNETRHLEGQNNNGTLFVGVLDTKGIMGKSKIALQEHENLTSIPAQDFHNITGNISLPSTQTNTTVTSAVLNEILLLLGQSGLGKLLGQQTNASIIQQPAAVQPAVPSVVAGTAVVATTVPPPQCKINAVCSAWQPCPYPCQCSNVNNPKMSGRCYKSPAKSPLMASMTIGG